MKRMDRHPSASKGDREIPSPWGLPAASFPALSSGSHDQGADLPPLPPPASDSGRRPGERTRSTDRRWSPQGQAGLERRSSSITGASPALSLGPSLLPLPDAGHHHRSCFLQLFPESSPAALQGSVDPALNPSLAFATSHLEGRGDEDHIWLHPSSTG